jgi:hypothetical protein
MGSNKWYSAFSFIKGNSESLAPTSIITDFSLLIKSASERLKQLDRKSQNVDMKAKEAKESSNMKESVNKLYSDALNDI